MVDPRPVLSIQYLLLDLRYHRSFFIVEQELREGLFPEGNNTAVLIA